MRLCALNRSSQMDSLKGLCPLAMANIHWISQHSKRAEGLDVTSVMVTGSSGALVSSLATQGSCMLIGKTFGKRDGCKAWLVSSTETWCWSNFRGSWGQPKAQLDCCRLRDRAGPRTGWQPQGSAQRTHAPLWEMLSWPWVRSSVRNTSSAGSCAGSLKKTWKRNHLHEQLVRGHRGQRPLHWVSLHTHEPCPSHRAQRAASRPACRCWLSFKAHDF